MKPEKNYSDAIGLSLQKHEFDNLARYNHSSSTRLC